MSVKNLNWQDINESVFDALTLLKVKYPKDVHNFLDWYYKLEKKSYNQNDNKFKNWLYDGIPKMKRIVVLLNQEVKLNDNLLQNLFTSDKNLNQKTSESQEYYRNIRDISETIVNFLGCRKKIGQWYVKLLEVYRKESKFANNIDFFKDACSTTQIRLLQSKSY